MAGYIGIRGAPAIGVTMWNILQGTHGSFPFPLLSFPFVFLLLFVSSSFDFPPSSSSLAFVALVDSAHPTGDPLGPRGY